jgi:hypothetical protein
MYENITKIPAIGEKISLDMAWRHLYARTEGYVEKLYLKKIKKRKYSLFIRFLVQDDTFQEYNDRYYTISPKHFTLCED